MNSSDKMSTMGDLRCGCRDISNLTCSAKTRRCAFSPRRCSSWVARSCPPRKVISRAFLHLLSNAFLLIVSTTFKVRGDNWLIFHKHSRFGVNLIEINFISYLFSSTFKVIPSFNILFYCRHCSLCEELIMSLFSKAEVSAPAMEGTPAIP